jgi:hypothetical protein
MMDQAWRRLLPLDGHGQCRDRQIRPHVVTHRPADDLPCEKIEHDSQIEPSFLGWDISDVSEPDLIRPLGDEFLGEPVGGNRNVSTTLRQPAFEFKLGFSDFGLAG